MSALLQKQWDFTYKIAELIKYVYDELGWKLSYGDAYRDPRCPYGAAHSLHRKRLAVDFNLFVDGVWIDGVDPNGKLAANEVQMWAVIGMKWEEMGGTWGGRFSFGDYNHFSLEHEGFK